jgi:hypothetical protein
MRGSSVQQPDPPGLAGTETNVSDSSWNARPSTSWNASPSEAITPQSADAEISTSLTLRAPSVHTYGSAYAATSRMLARLNTTTVKEEEKRYLLRERRNLLDKKYAGSMTPEDENRLEYIRWSLDQIQDATDGRSLDALENVVHAYERFLSEMGDFRTELSNLAVTYQKQNKERTRNVLRTRRK